MKSDVKAAEYYMLRRGEQVDRMIREIKLHTGIKRSEQVIRYVLDLYYFQVIAQYKGSSEFEFGVQEE